jgi:hypothetical protein
LALQSCLAVLVISSTWQCLPSAVLDSACHPQYLLAVVLGSACHWQYLAVLAISSTCSGVFPDHLPNHSALVLDL